MISIVTPTYNRKNMLKDVIDSIRMQTYTDFEILIIDDCSTDGTDKFITDYVDDKRIKYFRNQKNMGPGYNRNFGFKQAQGDYVIFMDDDDYYLESDFFLKAVNIFESNKEKNLAFVSANAYVDHIKTGKRVCANIGHIGYIDGIKFLLNLKIKYNKPQSTFTTVFNRKILLEADLLTMKMVNDYAIYLRALLFGNAYIMQDRIGVYRVHNQNISSHIERDFLLQNLEERTWVKKRLKEKAENRHVRKWWKRQLLMLLKYYLLGTNPKFEDSFYIAKWMIKSSGFAPDLFLIVLIFLMIYKPFGALKKLKNIFKKER